MGDNNTTIKKYVSLYDYLAKEAYPNDIKRGEKEIVSVIDFVFKSAEKIYKKIMTCAIIVSFISAFFVIATLSNPGTRSGFMLTAIISAIFLIYLLTLPNKVFNQKCSKYELCIFRIKHKIIIEEPFQKIISKLASDQIKVWNFTNGSKEKRFSFRNFNNSISILLFSQEEEHKQFARLGFQSMAKKWKPAEDLRIEVLTKVDQKPCKNNQTADKSVPKKPNPDIFTKECPLYKDHTEKDSDIDYSNEMHKWIAGGKRSEYEKKRDQILEGNRAVEKNWRQFILDGARYEFRLEKNLTIQNAFDLITEELKNTQGSTKNFKGASGISMINTMLSTSEKKNRYKRAFLKSSQD